MVVVTWLADVAENAQYVYASCSCFEAITDNAFADVQLQE